MFYKNILSDNLDGISEFIKGMVFHEGTLQIDRLRIVETIGNQPCIRMGQELDKRSEFVVGTGGEVVNSYCTLYEVAYIFICLFLSGIGTALIHKNLIEKFKKVTNVNLIEKIKNDLSNLTEDEIFEGMKKPDIGIVASMDTDIIPLRYNKHQLWRLDPDVLTKRVAEIKSNQFALNYDIEKYPEYWIENDLEIANLSMENASTLPDAKIIQYYSVLKILLKDLGIDIKNVPLYFNFVPKEEMILNGPNNSFLKVLIGLHTPENRIKYRKITGMSHPWFITKACPNCGQGDKRVINSSLLKDGRTVKVRCRTNDYTFRNEHNDTILVKGCGFSYTFKVPDTPEDLYRFFCTEDYTLHFATRQLIGILKDTVDTPIGWVVTELGLLRDADGILKKDPYYIQGYGDHLEMITSALALEYFFIHEKIAGEVSALLKNQDLVVPRQLMLFGYDKPTDLIDPDVTVDNKNGKTVHVADTSVLKVRAKGMSVKEIFKKAIRVHSFSLEELLELRGKSINMFDDNSL